MSLPKITLYFREGSSDKVYQASIENSGGAFHVCFAYGRRGSTLTAGRKTTVPVSLPAAEKVYEKLVREKKTKGYTEGADGVPVKPAPAEAPWRAEIGAMRPMLLNEITEESAIRLIRDDAWCLQEKHDGCRLVIRVIASEPGGPVLVLGFNKLGNATGISEAIRESAATIGESCVLDGEAVGDEFHVFDALERAGRDLRMSAYMLRLAQAAHLTKKAGPAVNLVETFLTTNSKDDAYHAATQRKAEGIVFKRNHSPWSAGRPNSGGDALKFKFVATASFIVEKVNTKRSVALSVVRGPDHVMVGNVAIPPNRDIPKPGEIVEVRYLYAFPSGSIFQPVYLGKRDDVEASECNISQLKYKAA